MRKTLIAAALFAFAGSAFAAPVTSTISVGPPTMATAARSSSMLPNGSAVPCVNTVGTVMPGRCSVRARSGLPGGCRG